MRDSTLYARKKLAETGNIQKSFGRVVPGGLQEDVVRFVGAQDVVDEIGRYGHLTARFFLARVPPLDQAGNDGAVAEGAFQQARFGEPGIEIVAENIFLEQGIERDPAGGKQQRQVAETPDGEA
jgi:hypothetical protein